MTLGSRWCFSITRYRTVGNFNDFDYIEPKLSNIFLVLAWKFGGKLTTLNTDFSIWITDCKQDGQKYDPVYLEWRCTGTFLKPRSQCAIKIYVELLYISALNSPEVKKSTGDLLSATTSLYCTLSIWPKTSAELMQWNKNTQWSCVCCVAAASDLLLWWTVDPVHNERVLSVMESQAGKKQTAVPSNTVQFGTMQHKTTTGCNFTNCKFPPKQVFRFLLHNKKQTWQKQL